MKDEYVYCMCMCDKNVGENKLYMDSDLESLMCFWNWY